MERHRLPLPLALSLLVPMACIEEGDADIDADEEVDEEVDFRSTAIENTGHVGGTYLNTGSIALTNLLTLTNPDMLTPVFGHRLREVTLAAPGKTWNKVVYLSNQSTGRLAVKTTGGETLEGLALADTILKFDTTGDNIPDTEIKLEYEINVDSGQLYYYVMTTRPIGGAVWRRLCKGEQNLAVFVDGDWRSDPIDRRTGVDTMNGNDTITLACTDSAIHKCVAHGKRPTDADGEQRHEACVRAITASYDGRAHTATGTPIDINERIIPGEHFEILPSELILGGDFVREAEWSSEGATCVNRQALRKPETVPGCPSAPESRTVANCVIRVNNVDVPECAVSGAYGDYGTDFGYDPTLMVTYASQSASQSQYDPVKDVYWGVESDPAETKLFKGILKDGIQTVSDRGTTTALVKQPLGNYALVPVRIDGLLYSEANSSLMGFQINDTAKQSRLAWVRSNGRVYGQKTWFDGSVRGAEENGVDSIRALVRNHTDPAFPNSKLFDVNPLTGEVSKVFNIVISDGAGGYTPFVISDSADIARRLDLDPSAGKYDWYITNDNRLYSLSDQTVTYLGQPAYVVTLIKLYGGGAAFAGLTFAHPTSKFDGNPDNDFLLSLDTEGTDTLYFLRLFSTFSVQLFSDSILPSHEGITGDLASWNPWISE